MKDSSEPNVQQDTLAVHKPALRPGLTNLGVVTLIVLSTVLLTAQQASFNQITTLTESKSTEQQKNLTDLQQELTALQTQIAQQSALMNRMFGEIVPIPIPEDVNVYLNQLEIMLNSQTDWPLDQTSTEAAFEELGKALSDIPVWIQEDMLPRIVPLRWSLDAIWYLRAQPEDDDTRIELLANLELLQNNRPRGAPQVVSDNINATIERLTAAIEESDRMTADLIISNAMSDNATAEDMLTALEVLAQQDLEGAADTASMIERNLSKLTFREMLGRISDQLAQINDEADDEVKFSAMSQISNAMIDLQISIATASSTSPELASDTEFTALTNDVTELDSQIKLSFNSMQSAAQTQQAKRLRDYQVWALEKMRNIRPYADVLEEELQKIESAFDRNNPVGEARTTAIRTAQQNHRRSLVDNLSVIDASLLDVAVGDWFRRVYADGFSKLSDPIEQQELISGFANSVKTGIGEIP